MVAHEQLGRALKVGHTYELLIENLEDVYHQKMLQPYRKTIHVIEADTIAPDIEQWEINSPEARTMNPLIISFQDVVDQYSLQHRLILTDTSNKPVPGQSEAGANETRWQFTPETPWLAGTYHLYINARLADPSGNNLNGLFDHKVGSLKYDDEGETLSVDIVID